MSSSPSEVVTRTMAGHVAVLQVRKPPANFFDQAVIAGLADLGHEAAADGARAIVLSSEGRHFCAGADFSGGDMADDSSGTARRIYGEAVRLFELPIPVVAAVQGRAVGGGLGLACVADFRVAGPSTRFHANFAALGFHQGFGLSVTLPRIVGQQDAARLLLGAAAIRAAEARAIGLADEVVEDDDEILPAAVALAATLAAQAPLAVRSIRATLRSGLADAVRDVLQHELAEQDVLWRTDDAAEGILASQERRTPVFRSR